MIAAKCSLELGKAFDLCREQRENVDLVNVMRLGDSVSATYAWSCTIQSETACDHTQQESVPIGILPPHNYRSENSTGRHRHRSSLHIALVVIKEVRSVMIGCLRHRGATSCALLTISYSIIVGVRVECVGVSRTWHPWVGSSPASPRLSYTQAISQWRRASRHGTTHAIFPCVSCNPNHTTMKRLFTKFWTLIEPSTIFEYESVWNLNYTWMSCSRHKIRCSHLNTVREIHRW